MERRANLQELNAEMAQHLNAPLPGLTREDRWEQVETEAWAGLQGLPGA